LDHPKCFDQKRHVLVSLPLTDVEHVGRADAEPDLPGALRLEVPDRVEALLGRFRYRRHLGDEGREMPADRCRSSAGWGDDPPGTGYRISNQEVIHRPRQGTRVDLRKLKWKKVMNRDHETGRLDQGKVVVGEMNQAQARSRQAQGQDRLLGQAVGRGVYG